MLRSTRHCRNNPSISAWSAPTLRGKKFFQSTPMMACRGNHHWNLCRKVTRLTLQTEKVGEVSIDPPARESLQSRYPGIGGFFRFNRLNVNPMRERMQQIPWERSQWLPISRRGVSSQGRSLVSLAFSLVCLGIVLAAYEVSVWGWLGTLACACHLAWAGSGAIPMAMGWMIFVLTLAAYTYAEPQLFMWHSGPLWATSLIVLWVVSSIIIFALAHGSQRLEWTGWSQTKRSRTMAAIACLSLGAGWCAYQLAI